MNKEAGKGEEPRFLRSRKCSVRSQFLYYFLKKKSIYLFGSVVLLPGKSHEWRSLEGCSEGRIPLSDFTFPFHFPALEKEMATHSSVLAWRIPGTGEPGGLPSMGSHRVGHD